MGTNGVGSYEAFLNTIKQRGLGTTSLGNGEANFADYANALSSGLKEELLQSIGDEAGDALNIHCNLTGHFICTHKKIIRQSWLCV